MVKKAAIGGEGPSARWWGYHAGGEGWKRERSRGSRAGGGGGCRLEWVGEQAAAPEGREVAAFILLFQRSASRVSLVPPSRCRTPSLVHTFPFV